MLPCPFPTMITIKINIIECLFEGPNYFLSSTFTKDIIICKLCIRDMTKPSDGNSRDLENVELSLITIAPWSTLTRSGRTT